MTTQSLRKSVLDIGHRIGRPVLVPPGAKLLVMALCALPVAIIGLSASTIAETANGPLAALWLVLLLVALYKRWAAVALLFVPAALLFVSLFAVPLNSSAFVVDFWTSALMLVLALPRRELT